MKHVCLLWILIFLIQSCSHQRGLNENRKRPKNIILMIGDGMGPQQISMLYLYSQYAPNRHYKDFSFGKLYKEGVLGTTFTSPYQSLVVDSASSATQMALGEPSRSEMIGLNYRGDRVETVLEMAKRLGKSTGLVSDTRITHATPAAFAAHVPHRSMETEIAEQLLQGQVDVMLSGGLSYFTPASMKNSKRKDDKNLLEMAKARGYDFVQNKKQLEKSEGGKILGLFSDSGMPNGIWYSQNENLRKRTVPTLKEMSHKALETLSQNPNGFFLMIEGGQIDWASHVNDAGTMLHQMIHFDKTLKMVLDWVQSREDTLLVVTSDHETGSFGFSYSMAGVPSPMSLKGKNFSFAPRYNFGQMQTLDAIYNQKISFSDLFRNFDQLPLEEKNEATLVNWVKRYTDFSLTSQAAKSILKDVKNPYYNQKKKSLRDLFIARMGDLQEFYVNNSRAPALSRALSPAQGIVWGTGTHTATPVYVGSYGPGQELFKGAYPNTMIGQNIKQLLD